jgi:hypothetical protein
MSVIRIHNISGDDELHGLTQNTEGEEKAF